MRFNRIILLLMCSSILIGCNLSTNSNVNKDKEISLEEFNIDESNTNIEDNSNLGVNLKNIIVNKNDVEIADNSRNISDLELRNNSMADEYIRGAQLVKEFCEKNSIKLTYAQPLKDKIASVSPVSGADNPGYRILLEKINSTDTLNYFTDEEMLNVDLSIGMGGVVDDSKIGERDTTYINILFKASISNIDTNFNFKESKLNEFRNMTVGSEIELDFDKMGEFIDGYFNGKYDEDMRFFNKIDENRYESIRIKENIIYYKLVYNPAI